jgi:hypothetical protein
MQKSPRFKAACFLVHILIFVQSHTECRSTDLGGPPPLPPHILYTVHFWEQCKRLSMQRCCKMRLKPLGGNF